MSAQRAKRMKRSVTNTSKPASLKAECTALALFQSGDVDDDRLAGDAAGYPPVGIIISRSGKSSMKPAAPRRLRH